MKFINLDQNTKDWLEQRKSYIGGSDLGALMLVSPWRSPLMLWEEKLGLCTPDQAEKAFIFDKGHLFESIARAKFEPRIGYDIGPRIVQHEFLPYCRVSLDCFNRVKGFVGEIKYMGKASFELLKEKQEVPEHYYPQVQYQLLATGFKELYFIGINENKDIAYTKVLPDETYMIKMIQWCNYFWSLVQSKTPPAFTKLDHKRFSRKEGKKAAHRIFDIDKQIGDLLDEREDLQDLVLSQAKSTRMSFDDKSLIRICDFDHDNLDNIIDLKGIDKKQLARSIRDNLKLIVLNRNFELRGDNVKEEKRE